MESMDQLLQPVVCSQDQIYHSKNSQIDQLKLRHDEVLDEIKPLRINIRKTGHQKSVLLKRLKELSDLEEEFELNLEKKLSERQSLKIEIQRQATCKSESSRNSDNATEIVLPDGESLKSAREVETKLSRNSDPESLNEIITPCLEDDVNNEESEMEFMILEVRSNVSTIVVERNSADSIGSKRHQSNDTTPTTGMQTRKKCKDATPTTGMQTRKKTKQYGLKVDQPQNSISNESQELIKDKDSAPIAVKRRSKKKVDQPQNSISNESQELIKDKDSAPIAVKRRSKKKDDSTGDFLVIQPQSSISNDESLDVIKDRDDALNAVKRRSKKQIGSNRNIPLSSDQNPNDDQISNDETVKQKDDISKVSPNGTKKSKQLRIKCKLCSMTFRRDDLLKSHTVLKHSNIKLHGCNECGAKYKYAKELIQHMNRHTGALPYVCKVCGKGFARMRNLMAHSKVHEQSMNHLCTTCGKNFRSNLHLRKHMIIHRRVHECEECQRKFTTSRRLKIHSLQHSGERPFVCELCGKGLSTKSGYGYHMKSHEVVKPFVCKLCGTGFVQQAALRDHMRMHTGEKKYQCKLCSLKFAYRNSFVLHLFKEHDDVDKAPHACQQCDMKFTRPFKLKIHLRSAHGEGRLQCTHCSNSYSRAHSLEDHLATIHGVGIKRHQKLIELC